MAQNEQPASRLKQYYVVRTYQEKSVGNWKEGQIVEVDPELAVPYIGARILVPLASAIRTKLIPPIDPKLAQQIEQESHAPSTFNTVVDQDKSNKKTLVKNTLKEAIQEKKEALEESREEVVLTPSIEPEFIEPPKELTAQEKAIQDKIAALKKKK